MLLKEGRLKCSYSFLLMESNVIFSMERNRKISSSNLYLKPWGQQSGSLKKDGKQMKSNSFQGYLSARTRQIWLLLIVRSIRSEKQKRYFWDAFFALQIPLTFQELLFLLAAPRCFFPLPFVRVCGKLWVHLLHLGCLMKFDGNNK